jgi:CRP-like cAMP-binding protein
MMNQHNFDVEKVIARSPWFKNLPKEQQAILVKHSKVEMIEANSYLFSVGQSTSHLYCVLSGWIRASVNSAYGDEFALNDLHEGSWAGEASLYNDLPRVIDLQAKEDSWVLKVPRAAVIRAGEAYPLMYRDISQFQVARTRGVFELLAGMVLYPLKSRLAGRMLAMAHEFGETVETGVAIPQKMSQTDLARLCVGSRQRVNKILRDWSARGIIAHEGDFYVITNMEALAEEVEVTEGE